MDKAAVSAKKAEYERRLFDDVILFWLRHSLDRALGGYWTGLDREGRVIETDKSVWFQGRMAWTFATLYADFRSDPAYRDAAKLGIDFLERHGFDDDGKMFFRLTQDGQPVIKRRRYFGAETVATSAHAAWARAGGGTASVDRAREILARVDRYRATPGLLEPKTDPRTRPGRSFAEPMILLATVQELRRADPARRAEYDARADAHVAEIRAFLDPGHRAVLESIGPGGPDLEHFEGRLLNPGHAIEGAWFVLRESRERGRDPGLRELGLTMLDWMWTWGWDPEHGGILYFRDVLGMPVAEYWHEMKFWWPHNEAVVATLMAYAETGEERYAHWFHDVDAWAHRHFPDPEHGEWFGYLRRDGRVSSTLKGSIYKGCFHLPRMYMVCLGLLEEMGSQRAGM